MRPIAFTMFCAPVSGTSDTVPSRSMATRESGGIVIGPPSPCTGMPALVCSTPFSEMPKLPARV